MMVTPWNASGQNQGGNAGFGGWAAGGMAMGGGGWGNAGNGGGFSMSSSFGHHAYQDGPAKRSVANG